MLKCVLGWCLPLDYQKLESPTPDEPVRKASVGKKRIQNYIRVQVHVNINVEILDILDVNDKEFSITMSM
jgi:hypothetical protein